MTCSTGRTTASSTWHPHPLPRHRSGPPSRPRLYYAHLINDQSMYIAFPNCLVHLTRADEDGERQAQVIGETFDIPMSQMRFLEMFEVDHPDAPVQVGG